MKRVALFIGFAVCLLSLLIYTVFAHPGRTDSNGGHTDHSTGEYHYHHGYSAHDHYDMDGDGDIDCPFNFVDKTNHSSDSGSRSSSYDDAATTPVIITSESKKYSGSNDDWGPIVVFVLLVGFWIMPVFFNKK